MRTIGDIRSPEVGHVLGQFRLLEVLGQGGMATVFRAEHERVGHQVALKVLHPAFCGERLVLRRFFAEVQAMRRAHHPNIREVADLISSPHYPPYIVMELLHGDDLATVLETRAPVTPDKAVAIATQMCSAVAAIHSQGVVHRDLKPENVFLVGGADDDYPIVKLLDFGLAKFVADSEKDEDDDARTPTGDLLGTPGFMAPEMIRGEPVDHRCDLYAIGVTLYVLLSGQMPHEQFANVTEQLEHQAHRDPIALTAFGNAPAGVPIPAALETVVMRCLEREPARRLDDAAALGRYLDASLEPGGEVELPPLPAAPSPAPVGRATRVKRWLTAAVASAVAGGVVSLVWWASHR